MPPRSAAVLAGVAVWVFIGGVAGAAAGLVVAVLADRVLRRLEPAERRHERRLASADLPFAVDLVDAVLRGGGTVDNALRWVADGIGGPLGARLGRVAAAYALDADPSDVWQPLADLPAAQPVIRAALRSGRSGAALSAALQRAAEAARMDEDAAAEASARRAGVLVVLPVGLCFLPAFVLLGVVPAAAGVLAQTLG